MCSAKRARNQRKPEESSAAQVIASIDDLLSEILLRLPIKSLLKFKSVSKQWLALITDPHFTRRKNLKSNAVYGIFSHTWDNPRFRNYLVPLHPLKRRALLTSITFVDGIHRSIAIISSCKGLLLCYRSSIDLNRRESKCYYIINPTTKQFRTLPPLLPDQAANVEAMGFCLAFDPTKSHSYKVACIVRVAPSYCSGLYCRSQIVVYSSQTGRWKKSGAQFRLHSRVFFHNGVYCSGTIHWVCQYGDSVWFDMEKELAQGMPIPPGHCRCWRTNIAYFGESGGHLHLIFNSTMTKLRLPVYEMERDGSGWFVKFQIDLNEVVSSRQLHTNFCKQVLHVARGEEKEDSFVVICVPGKVIRYNFGDKTHQVIYNSSRRKVSKLIQCDFSKKTCEVIGKTDVQTKCNGWPFAFQFIESLNPV